MRYTARVKVTAMSTLLIHARLAKNLRKLARNSGIVIMNPKTPIPRARANIQAQISRIRFDSLDDFILRTGVARSIVENLISVGAFESIGRKGMLSLSLTALDRLKYVLSEKAKPLFVYFNYRCHIFYAGTKRNRISIPVARFHPSERYF